MTPHERWDDDRAQGGGIAGDWRSAQPRFDDPMSWSLPISHVAGVTVRVHALFLVAIVAWLLKSMLVDPSTGAATPFDLPHTVVVLIALFLIVLLHEFGHVAACRRVGGDADEILLWPLGGLASVDPPRRWTAELATTLGGPAVNAAIWVIGALVLGFGAGWKMSTLAPNPLNPTAFASMPNSALETVFLVHWINWVLLLFNLLPFFPLDGGRVLLALLSRRLGFADATRIASRIGVVGAALMAVAAIVVESWTLGAVAVFCVLTCWASLKRIDYADAVEQGTEDPESARSRLVAERRAERRAERERRAREAKARDRARLDEILAKIGREGRESLRWSERRFLKRTTRRLRDE
ncbi:MAG: hypothetical protein FJ253_01390 [Phycisphaerae bacterium]|nr:hypothetical protein [Phycisphaerae bacterium]